MKMLMKIRPRKKKYAWTRLLKRLVNFISDISFIFAFSFVLSTKSYIIQLNQWFLPNVHYIQDEKASHFEVFNDFVPLETRWYQLQYKSKWKKKNKRKMNEKNCTPSTWMKMVLMYFCAHLCAEFTPIKIYSQPLMSMNTAQVTHTHTQCFQLYVWFHYTILVNANCFVMAACKLVSMKWREHPNSSGWIYTPIFMLF